MEQIAQFKKMLQNLDHCLEKAAAHADQKKFDANVFVTCRLAPDMFTFAQQIQSACDAAKFCAAYLAGKEAPKHPDTETKFTELRERIKSVVTYLDGFKTGDFANAEQSKVAPKWAGGKWLNGTEYYHELAIPNFYFHVTMAYAILRHNGVDIGKTDYIGNLNFKG